MALVEGPTNHRRQGRTIRPGPWGIDCVCFFFAHSWCLSIIHLFTSFRFLQRKDYSALTKFLPPKHEYVISVRLTSVQIKLYELYLQSQSRNNSGELIEGSSKGSGAGLFADYQQLMQIWTHPHVLKLSEIRQEKIVGLLLSSLPLLSVRAQAPCFQLDANNQTCIKPPYCHNPGYSGLGITLNCRSFIDLSQTNTGNTDREL